MIASSVMKTTLCTLMLGASGTAMAQGSPPAAGQSNAASATGGLQDIIVTARRKEENLQDVPLAVSAFSTETLARAGVTRAEDLVRVTPSLQFSRFVGSPVASSFGIRGQRTNDIRMHNDSAVVPYVAEVPQHLAFGLGITGFLDVQSVQVLRGPQGTLFGRNSTGGAILITPNTPTDTLGGSVKLTYGNYNKIEGQAVVNVPISEDVGFRAAFVSGQRDPWFRNRTPGFRDFNGESYHGGRASFKVESGDFTSTFYGDYLNFRGTGQSARIVALNPRGVGALYPLGRGGGLAAVLARNQLPGNFYSTESSLNTSSSAKVWGVSNTSTYQLSDAVLFKNIIGYRDVRYSQRTDADGSPFQLVDSFIPGDGRQFTEEFQIQYDQGIVHVIGGLFYFNEKGNDYNDKGRLGPSVLLAGLSGNITYNHELKNTAKSAFFEGTIDVTPALHLTAGARYTKDYRYRNARNFSGPTLTTQTCRIRDDNGVPLPDNACFTEASVSFKKPTFNLTAKYDLADRQQVYASWRRGYRTGGFSLDPLLITAGNTPFKPETVDSYEGGYKGEFGLGGDAGLRINLAGYYSDYQNVQKNQNLTVTFPGPPATTVLQTITVNAAKARIWGIELESTLSVSRNLQFNGSYSYTNAKYKSFIGTGNNNAPIDLSDLPFGFVPKHKLTGSAQWTIPLGEGSLNLSPSATYQSANEIEEVAGPGTHQPGYTLVNARADYDFGNGLNLAFWVNNFTKRKYNVAANNIYNAVGFSVAYPGEPRMYGAELSFKF